MGFKNYKRKRWWFNGSWGDLKLTPPEFKVSDVTENSINLHYFLKREGLQDFVRGLIQGLGKMYKTPVTIKLIQTRDEGSSHEIFNVIW
jgi:hypothetical protein